MTPLDLPGSPPRAPGSARPDASAGRRGDTAAPQGPRQATEFGAMVRDAAPGTPRAATPSGKPGERPETGEFRVAAEPRAADVTADPEPSEPAETEPVQTADPELASQQPVAPAAASELVPTAKQSESGAKASPPNAVEPTTLVRASAHAEPADDPDQQPAKDVPPKVVDGPSKPDAQPGTPAAAAQPAVGEVSAEARTARRDRMEAEELPPAPPSQPPAPTTAPQPLAAPAPMRPAPPLAGAAGPGDVAIGASQAAAPEWRLAAGTSVQAPGAEAARSLPVPQQAIAGQVAVAIAGARERHIEVRLDPPELGRVQIQIDTSDTGLRAIVLAERPETHDLLRRHADLLERELAEAGFRDVDLGFSRGGQAEREPGDDRPGSLAAVAARPDAAAVAPGRTGRTDGGLDVRL